MKLKMMRFKKDIYFKIDRVKSKTNSGMFSAKQKIRKKWLRQ